MCIFLFLKLTKLHVFREVFDSFSLVWVQVLLEMAFATYDLVGVEITVLNCAAGVSHLELVLELFPVVLGTVVHGAVDFLEAISFAQLVNNVEALVGGSWLTVTYVVFVNNALF